MKWFIGATAILGIVLYLRSRWIQPEEVVGTFLDDTKERRAMTIQAVRDQERRLGTSL